MTTITCLMGAFTADAASLGLHWLYDVERIADVVRDSGQGSAAFLPVDAAHYADTRGYFAHALREPGALSQYGECLRLAVDAALAHDGRLDPTDYQQRFAAFFGAGGAYRGYIDKPTRATLTNLADGIDDPSGCDDDQLPAIARLPLVAAVGHDASDYLRNVDSAIRLTHTSEIAQLYGRVCAELLRRVLDGERLGSALKASARDAHESIRDGLLDALSTGESDSIAYGETTGRACGLAMGVPLAFHVMAHQDGYREAIETNIRCGGDSCGRAMLIGAVMGAHHGIHGTHGIPVDWLLRLHDGHALWQRCERLAGLGHVSAETRS